MDFKIEPLYFYFPRNYKKLIGAYDSNFSTFQKKGNFLALNGSNYWRSITRAEFLTELTLIGHLVYFLEETRLIVIVSFIKRNFWTVMSST